jgi:hypothetical protein
LKFAALLFMIQPSTANFLLVSVCATFVVPTVGHWVVLLSEPESCISVLLSLLLVLCSYICLLINCELLSLQPVDSNGARELETRV